MSSLQLKHFRTGQDLKQEVDVKAEKGAYFVVSDITLEADQEKNWMFVTNVNQSISGVIQLSELIKKEKNLAKLVQEDVNKGSKNLIKLFLNLHSKHLHFFKFVKI